MAFRVYADDNFYLVEEDLKWLRAIHVSIAKDVLREEQRANDFTRTPLTTVDGRRGVPEERVKLGGVIEYLDREKAVGQALVDALRYLYFRSPYGNFRKRGTGWFRPLHYRDLHVVTYNNREVFTSGDVFGQGGMQAFLKFTESLNPGDTVHIVNPMPYARRIEFGKGVNQFAQDSSREAARGDRRANPASVASWSTPDRVYRRAEKYVLRRIGGRRSGMWVKFQLVTASNLGYSFRYVRKTGRVELVGQLYPALRFVIGRGTGGSSTIASPTLGSITQR